MDRHTRSHITKDNDRERSGTNSLHSQIHGAKMTLAISALALALSIFSLYLVSRLADIVNELIDALQSEEGEPNGD
jgi:hypothetical protein